MHRPEWFPYVALGFPTGLRPGELASLKWRDVQLAGSTPSIRVRATRRKKPGPNGELDGPTKTNRNRTVPLNSAAVEVLKAHRHLRGEYVFYNGAGQPPDRNGGIKMLQMKNALDDEVTDVRGFPLPGRSLFATVSAAF